MYHTLHHLSKVVFPSNDNHEERIIPIRGPSTQKVVLSQEGKMMW